MIYPLIDITRPVRLTEYGKGILSTYSKFDITIPVTIEKEDPDYPLVIDGVGFSILGLYTVYDDSPSIENIPLDEIVNTTKTEDKMIKQIDVTKPVRFCKIDNGSTFEFLMTIKNEYYPHVFKSTNGNGYENVAQYSERGECVIKNMHDQLDIENIPQDTEPPEEIFDIWYEAIDYSNTIRDAGKGLYLSPAVAAYEFKKSKTYANWKNKKITVEDVK